MRSIPASLPAFAVACALLLHGPVVLDGQSKPTAAEAKQRHPVAATAAPVVRDASLPSVRDDSVASKAVGREMAYRVLLPAGYESGARRYPVLYLLHGLTGDFTDWDTRTHLVTHLAPYDLIVVMPDADDSWYSNAVAMAQQDYEDYVAKELLSDVDGKYRTIRTRHARAVAGLSMGGYGAMKLALKYPGSFVFAGSFSGALEAARDPKFMAGMPKYAEAFDKIMGPPAGTARAANDIFALAEKAEPARLPYLYIDCGTEDGLLAGNRDFVALLQKRAIPYEYRELPGAHTWSYWDQQLPQMLRVLAGHMSIEGRRP